MECGILVLYNDFKNRQTRAPPRQRASDQPDDKVTSEQKPTNLPETGSSDLLSAQINDNATPIFGDGLAGINKDGIITFINNTAWKLTGWQQGEAENQPFKKNI